MCWNDTERGRRWIGGFNHELKLELNCNQSADVKLEKGFHSSLSDIALWTSTIIFISNFKKRQPVGLVCAINFMRQSKTHHAIALRAWIHKDQLCKHCSLTKHLFRVHLNKPCCTHSVCRLKMLIIAVAIATVTAKTFVLRMFRLQTFLRLLTLDWMNTLTCKCVFLFWGLT